MDEPLGPLAETAVATHTLYQSYMEAGFTPDQALYLTGCVVATLGVAVARDEMSHSERLAAMSQAAGIRCAFCGRFVTPVEGRMVCPNPACRANSGRF